MAVYINGVLVSDKNQTAIGNTVGGKIIRNGKEVKQDDE